MMVESWDIYRALERWGAREVEHPGGTLLDHLVRTEELLRSWGADEALALSGLSHAAYGTDGFEVVLLPHAERQTLRTLIGHEAEALVYQYASCDRAYLGDQPGRCQTVSFRDRFDGKIIELEAPCLGPFMELTFANELDIVTHNKVFAADVGPVLGGWFTKCRSLVSTAAFLAFEDLLGDTVESS